MTANNTIARNTAYLYIRLLVTFFVTLYTSRVILQALGVEDFGIFNVVGGIVAMFSFLNSGMIQASQRFMSYEIGQNNDLRLKDVFTTTLIIHILIALIIIVAIESVGVWFLNCKMNISPERMHAANWVLQCSLLSFAVVVITVPFNSAIIAHEKMDIYAIVSVADALLKLGIAFVVKSTGFDRLIIYSVLLLLIPIVEFLFYAAFCRKNFEEASFKLKFQKNLFTKILSFAGWSFVGNIGFTVKGQGVNIVINLLCGAVVNAARGVAFQVSSQITAFVSNFQMAIVPQITKRYAYGDISGMTNLVFKGSKFSFLLLYFIALPFCLRADYVLNLWLGKAPEYSVGFVIFALITATIDGMAIPLGKSIDATGRIKWFQISIALVMLLDIPLTYCLLLTGVSPYYAGAVAVFTSFIALLVRLFIVKRRFVSFPVFEFVWKVVLKCFVVAFFTVIICWYINSFVPQTFWGLLIVCLQTIIVNSLFFYYLAFDKSEKEYINEILISRITKKFIRK